MGFYFGAPQDDKPDDIHIAMNGTGMTVFHMSRGSDKSTECSFASVFASEALVIPGGESITDPCSPNANCSSCIGDKSGLCGWCTQDVVYSDGTKGTQCAGFNRTGKPLGWQCLGVFSKTDCADYACDYTDLKAPKCVSGLGTQGKKDCTETCKPPTPQATCKG